MIANSLADVWIMFLVQFSCCYWITYLAPKQGQVSIFHCEKVASHSDVEGDRNGKKCANNPLKSLKSTHLVDALSLDNCATDSNLKKCYSIANDSVGKMYTTVSQCNKCLFASQISAPLFNQVLPFTPLLEM